MTNLSRDALTEETSWIKANMKIKSRKKQFSASIYHKWDPCYLMHAHPCYDWTGDDTVQIALICNHLDDFYRTQVYLGSDLWSRCHWCLVDLTDVCLVDEDTNSILADDTIRAIPGNLEMQVTQSYLVRKSYFVRKSCLVRKSYLVRKIYLLSDFIKNIATGETSQAITSFDNFHFFQLFSILLTIFTSFDYFHFFQLF